MIPHNIIGFLKNYAPLTRASLAGAMLCFFLVGCQGTENKDEEAAAVSTEEVTAADTTQVPRRPAPEFYVITPELKDRRVWICDDSNLDIFHVKNDCDYLRGCKGTFRYMTITRAIEEYGRYNCENCSSDLAYIFDENAIRMETGL